MRSSTEKINNIIMILKNPQEKTSSAEEIRLWKPFALVDRLTVL